MSHTPAVTSASVSSDLEALIEEFFAAVSFGEGERPAYENLRDLFIAEGKLINTGPQAPDVIDVGLSFGPSSGLSGFLGISTWLCRVTKAVSLGSLGMKAIPKYWSPVAIH